MTRFGTAVAGSTAPASGQIGSETPTLVTAVPVARIRPEEGLDRKRDREGHFELQQSIRQFGVLTPITVRSAGDGSGDYLLIKGQGRTLACRLLGIETIPAIVSDASDGQDEKVQQFLVENVARLKMRPVDRALLIRRARESGEETAEIAQRFGVTATTVRRLLAQLEEATSAEVAALRSGRMSLTLHAIIARHVEVSERAKVVKVVTAVDLKPKDLDAVFVALGWSKLSALGPQYGLQRLTLFSWACHSLASLSAGPVRERIRQIASNLPTEFGSDGANLASVIQ